MGLCMKPCLISTLVFLFTLGCVKEPTQEIDYGVEVPKEEVASTLQKAVGSTDSPGLIRAEEVVLREITRFIRGRPVLDILSTSEVTVVQKIETANQWQVKDVEKLQNYDPTDPTNISQPIVREDHKCWNKETLDIEECEIVPLPLKSLNVPSNIEGHLQPFSHFKQKSVESEKTITYHNLKTQIFETSPPESVTKSPNCQEIPNCRITVTQIEFDRVNWTENPEGYKIHYTLKLSKDVPQMSRFLESCQQGSVQVLQPNQDPKSAPRYLITFCDTVKNFVAGKL